MFRDVYKQAMDDIKPRDGLLDEIIKESKKRPKRNFKMATSYAASVAAVVVIAMVATAYPNLSELHNKRREEDKVLKTVVENKVENEAEEQITEKKENGEISVDSASGENTDVTQTKGPFSHTQTYPALNDEESESYEESNLSAKESDTAVAVGESEVNNKDIEAAYDLQDDSEAENANKENGVMIARAIDGVMSAFSGGAYNKETVISEAEAIAFAKNYVNISCTDVSAVYDAENNEWCICFYSESENVYVYLDAEGALIKTTTENI